MKVLSSSVIYENPLPQLRSRHSFFPFACQMKNGDLMAVTAIGEAFESVDSASFAHFSFDGGLTWTEPASMYDKGKMPFVHTDYCKPVSLKDGRIVLLGYSYVRDNPDLPIGNPENGGVLEDFLFFSVSEDGGKSWSDMKKIPCSWGGHAEASAPLTVLRDGSWVTPITGFPNWEGKMTGPVCGRLLRSNDEGETWNDDAVCMQFGNRNVTCYEQRICQLESGALVCIAWNEDLDTGERLPNHYTVSYDNGVHWSDPISTGVMGQASSVCAIGGEKLLALHAVRRDTDRPGIYAYIVDFSKKRWDILEEKVIWEPATPVMKDEKMADIFSFLKFGQPGAILLSDGTALMTHWYCRDGQYKTLATRIDLS